MDTADAADPQESTATDVESTNTRRGGRGRGRKGTAATVKETAQVHSAEYITVLDWTHLQLRYDNPICTTTGLVLSTQQSVS